MQSILMSKIIGETNATGSNWFKPSEMRWWNTTIHTRKATVGPDGRAYFVTSEKMRDDDEPRFTVRAFLPEAMRRRNEAPIDTVGEFQGYETLAEAEAAIQGLVSA